MASAAASLVLVTRPAREAAAWVEALQARGIVARAFPLIDIGPAPDPQAVEAARPTLASFEAVMFVSANAVQGLLPTAGLWPVRGPRAWATGPGTGEALRRAGVPVEAIDIPPPGSPQLDSEALWAQVGDRLAPGGKVLIVRGADAQGHASGRDWLAQQLHSRGIEVRFIAAYRRQRPDWDTPQQAQAVAASAEGWWLFSSSEAVENLRSLLPQLDLGAARALCTHPRIAQAARRAGFGQVAQTQSSLEAVASFLQSGA